MSGGTPSDFSLRRVLQSWEEGSKPGLTGAPATEGEASWTMRVSPGTPWSQAGGALGSDFAATPSASVRVAGPERYTFNSTTNLVADVQTWVDSPASNFGWVLSSDLESLPETARRFGAREDADRAAQLTIEYAPPPAPLRIIDLRLTPTQAIVVWEGGTAPFRVETRAEVSTGPWVAAGPPTSERMATLARQGEQMFVRVIQVPPLSAAETANYEVVFASTWSSTTHPQAFPAGAHWSGLVGGTHNEGVVFWEEGMLATEGIRRMAEFGSKPVLLGEVAASIQAGMAWGTLSGGGVSGGPGQVALSFTIHRDFPLVTLVSMIAPSPDWFTGVHGLSLIANGDWVAQKVVTLHLYDAGTDSGASYASPDAATVPREMIRQITGFPAEVDGVLVPFGTFTFTRKS
jgi:hypothetical protein